MGSIESCFPKVSDYTDGDMRFDSKNYVDSGFFSEEYSTLFYTSDAALEVIARELRIAELNIHPTKPRKRKTNGKNSKANNYLMSKKLLSFDSAKLDNDEFVDNFEHRIERKTEVQTSSTKCKVGNGGAGSSIFLFTDE